MKLQLRNMAGPSGTVLRQSHLVKCVGISDLCKILTNLYLDFSMHGEQAITHPHLITFIVTMTMPCRREIKFIISTLSSIWRYCRWTLDVLVKQLRPSTKLSQPQGRIKTWAAWTSVWAGSITWVKRIRNRWKERVIWECLVLKEMA